MSAGSRVGRGRALALVSYALVGGACAGTPAPAPIAASDVVRGDPLAPLLAALPEGATSCIAVRTARVVDRRRALVETRSRAGALAWARIPHVRAYVRCDVGENDARVELVAIDDLDVSDRAAVEAALSLSVRWTGEPCEHDECDWPEVSAVGRGALALRRRTPTGAAAGGVEGALARLALERPDALELSVSAEGARVLLPAADGIEELAFSADGRSATEAWGWEELELAVEDRRISEDAVAADAEERALRDPAELAEAGVEEVRSQLGARVSRARRGGRGASEAARAAIAAIARDALARWPGDLVVVAEASRALALASAAHEALERIDQLAIAAAGDAAALGVLEALGRELALYARDASLVERLVAAGVAEAESDGPSVAEALGALVEGHGMDYGEAEAVVRLARERVSEAPALGATEATISARALVGALWLFAGGRSSALHLEVWLRGAAVTPPASRSSPGLTVVGVTDGLHVRALGRPGERLLSIAEVVENALASSSAGAALELVLRAESDGVIRVLRAAGTVEPGAGVVRLSAVSPGVAALGAERIERALAQPLDALLSRRFPAPELHWATSTGDPERPAIERALRRAGVRGCEVSAAAIDCEPGAAGASDGLAMIVAVAQALGVLP